jgi:hypothetical protein
MFLAIEKPRMLNEPPHGPAGPRRANIDRINAGVIAGGTPHAWHVRETFAHA